MNEVMVKDDIRIENMIYEIRGRQVMLDSDLAKLYHCANGTKSINLAVKRNVNRFPNDFYFQLTEEEMQKTSLRFQIETLNANGNNRGQHIKYLPYAFTEQGVVMLSSVLHTEVAEEVSVKIMRAFVVMRKYISTNLIEQKYINNLVLEDHNRIELLENSFQFLEENKIKQTIIEDIDKITKR